MKFKQILILVLFLLLGISATYADKKQEVGYTIYKIQNANKVKTIYFSSIISPIRKTGVISQAEGTIIKKNFEYGQLIKQGELLAVINSAKLESTYHDMLTQYLDAKEKYFSSKSKYNDNMRLWKLGYISRDEYENTKSSYNQANMAYLKTLYNLQELSKKGLINAGKIIGLDISNIAEVSKVLKEKKNTLDLISPAVGVAILPPNTSDSNDNQKIEVGSQVKEGQPIVLIGDLTGLALPIRVTEIDIHDIKIGQKVTITGVAFPKVTLLGEITHIDAQASSSQGLSVSSFGVIVTVKQLTKKQAKDIMVGMTAKLQIDIVTPNTIEIPIKAVIDKNGDAYVKVSHNGHIQEVHIETGQTTLEKVEVVKGLKAGDQIVVPN